jgi:hypothetical protein
MSAHLQIATFREADLSLRGHKSRNLEIIQVILSNNQEAIENNKHMVQDFDVIRSFEATAPISGRNRRFEPGDVIARDMGQRGEMVAIEADSSLFLIDRATFKICCKFRNAGATSV